MNRKIIFSILGKILILEAILMVPSLAVSLFYQESCTVSFVISILGTAVAGFILKWFKPENTRMSPREGFVVVGLAWVILSIFGALPFIISGAIPSFIDAFFETASGFTTTGASILNEVESLDHGILFWRSFTHWVGGMGILVFLLAVVSQSNDYGMHMLRAESPGPSVGKIVPKLKNTAKILYQMYFALTIIMIICLLLVKMPLFDAVCNAMATAGTGGFAIKNTSIAAYNSVSVEVIITIFMILFGVNFNIYYFILAKKYKEIFHNEELKVYLGIILASIAIITLNILGRYANIWEALRYSSFSVATIISTTGFGTADFNLWPTLSKVILCLLMIIGACAGNTAGGLKVSRFMILVKSVKREIIKIANPREITRIRVDGKSVEERLSSGVSVYLTVYVFIVLCSIILISIDGFDFETTVTAVLSCFNNIGPGLGMVGPTGNFSSFSDFSKIILSMDMLLGRLEIFPLLLLMTPSVWIKK